MEAVQLQPILEPGLQRQIYQALKEIHPHLIMNLWEACARQSRGPLISLELRCEHVPLSLGSACHFSGPPFLHLQKLLSELPTSSEVGKMPTLCPTQGCLTRLSQTISPGAITASPRIFNRSGWDSCRHCGAGTTAQSTKPAPSPAMQMQTGVGETWECSFLPRENNEKNMFLGVVLGYKYKRKIFIEKLFHEAKIKPRLSWKPLSGAITYMHWRFPLAQLNNQKISY